MRWMSAVAIMFASLPLFLAAENVHAKKMYRWVDDQGNVFFSDVVPPDQVQHKRETLSEKARVVDMVEKAKTSAEREQQKRLDALRKQQEKLIAKQAADDKVLLSTYRSLEDMQSVLDKKLQGFDSDKSLQTGNLQLLEKQLVRQQQQAADLERNGKAIPAKLLDEIKSSQQQIDAIKQTLQHNQLDRDRYETAFKADMARFAFLTQGSEGVKARIGQAADEAGGNELGLYVCKDADECRQAWKIAGEFVEKYATTAKDVETETLIIRAAPVEDNDMSLSISLISEQHQQQIFLDIRCKASTVGSDLCAGEKAQAIRRGFVPYIQLQLSSKQ